MRRIIKVALICALVALLAATSALAAGSLVGEWNGNGKISVLGAKYSATAQAQFSEGNLFSLSVRVPGLELEQMLAGTYQLTGTALTLSAPGYDAQTVTCKLSGDTAKLTGKLVLKGFDVGCDFTLRRKAAPAPAFLIVVTEKADALVKAGDVYEAIKGAELPGLTWQTEDDTWADAKAAWKSGKAKVLGVDKSGNLKAKKPGQAKVTLTVKLGKLKSTDAITVRVVEATIKQKKATLFVGGTTKKKPATIQLKPVIKPAAASDTAKAVTWQSDDAQVATVDAEGLVTAVAAGKANITMTNGYGQTAVCAITVKE